MKHESDEPAALEKRAQPGRLPAILLAVGVHAAFFALIVFGVTWQSSPTPPVQAELWDKLPTTKAPAKPQPEPEPPKPEPSKPEPKKPDPAKAAPKEDPRPVKPDPAIAEKAEQARKEKEKREKEKADRLQKQKQEDAAKKKRDDDKRRVEEERAKKEAEKAREEAASARQKLIDGFVAQIRAKIRGRANVPDTVSGKPSVQVRIRILPGGEVLDIAITHPSGNRVYDTAIERAIRSASPLPVPEVNSELFPQFRDLTLNIEHER